jgi:hypothetical protein
MRGVADGGGNPVESTAGVSRGLDVTGGMTDCQFGQARRSDESNRNIFKKSPILFQKKLIRLHTITSGGACIISWSPPVMDLVRPSKFDRNYQTRRDTCLNDLFNRSYYYGTRSSSQINTIAIQFSRGTRFTKVKPTNRGAEVRFSSISLMLLGLMKYLRHT